MKKKKSIIIAGPCAAESQEQIQIAIQQAKKRTIDFLRVNLWKPRTKPGFEGLGEKGLPLLVQVAKAGLNPSLEVMTAEQTQRVMETVLPHVGKKGKLLVWIGSRNQNHFVQKEIAQVASRDKRVFLLVKNQPWVNEEHWEGIIRHVISGGLSKENIINCHRGFAPIGNDPFGLRNIPDFQMAMRIKQTTGIPIVFDPSHTGGTVENVLHIGQRANKFDFDGVIVEVHHDPKNALTDAKQQLTWREFDELVKEWV